MFGKSKSFNSYHQHNIYQFNEKYSKLFYKFLVGYKFLIGKSIFVRSDVLMKILNIHTDKSISKIQSDIFDHLVAIIGNFELNIFQSPNGVK